MISSPKAFRKLVIKVEKQFKAGSLNGVALVLDDINNSFPEFSGCRAIKLCSCIEKIVQNRSGHLTFEDRARCLNLRMKRKIKAQKERNRIRKQEEAPEAQAVDGAESSLKLCDGCKNTFQNDYDVCPDCSQLGGA